MKTRHEQAFEIRKRLHLAKGFLSFQVGDGSSFHNRYVFSMIADNLSKLNTVPDYFCRN